MSTQNLTSPHLPETAAPTTMDWLAIAKADSTRNKFLKCVGSILSSAPNVPVRMWAFAMIAPVETLQVYINDLESLVLTGQDLTTLDKDIKIALKAWQQSGSKESDSDSDNEAPPSKRQKIESITPSVEATAPSEPIMLETQSTPVRGGPVSRKGKSTPRRGRLRGGSKAGSTPQRTEWTRPLRSYRDDAAKKTVRHLSLISVSETNSKLVSETRSRNLHPPRFHAA